MHTVMENLGGSVMGYRAMLFSVPTSNLGPSPFWLKLAAIWDYLEDLARQAGHLISATRKTDLICGAASKKPKPPANIQGPT